ncbi:hypothetical protein [Pseudomonas sp. LB3P14]
MTAQQQVLLPPALPDASNGVLYMNKLKDPVQGLVHQYENAAAEDKVELVVTTSTGNNWFGSITLTPGFVFPFVFAIPKATFAKNLVSGATAKLHYTITKAGNSALSPPLTVSLEP